MRHLLSWLNTVCEYNTIQGDKAQKQAYPVTMATGCVARSKGGGVGGSESVKLVLFLLGSRQRDRKHLPSDKRVHFTEELKTEREVEQGESNHTGASDKCTTRRKKDAMHSRDRGEGKTRPCLVQMQKNKKRNNQQMWLWFWLRCVPSDPWLAFWLLQYVSVIEWPDITIYRVLW